MQNMLTQPSGPVAKSVNLQSLARIYNKRQRQVGYLTTHTPIDSYLILYEPNTETQWYRDTATGTPISWSVSNNLLTVTTNVGTFSCKPARGYDELTNLLGSHTEGEGAGLIGLTGGGYVSDGLRCVYASTYGVKLSLVSSIVNGTATDVSTNLQNAINAAKNMGVPLVIDIALQQGPSVGAYFYVTKSIIATGIRAIRGPLYLGAMPATMQETWKTAGDDPRPVMFVNANGTFDSSGKIYFSTTTGGQTFDEIQTAFIVDQPNDKWVGQLHITAYSHFKGQLWGRRCGTVIWFANSYDNTFAAQIACTDAGSINYYPFMVASYPYADKTDESNSMTFPRILLHSNKYRDGLIVGSKIHISAIHAEAVVVGSIDGFTKNNFDNFCPTGLATLVLGLTGGSVGNVNFNSHATSTTPGYLLANMLGTDIAHIYSDANSPTMISDVYYLERGGSIGSIYTRSDVYTNGGSPIPIGAIVTTGNLTNNAVYSQIGYAKVGGDIVNNQGVIDRAVVSGSVTQNQYGHIKNGTCGGNFTMTASGKLEYFTVGGTYNSAAAGPILTNVTFNGVFNNTGGGTHIRCTIPNLSIKTTSSATVYRDCVLSGAVTAGVANARATIYDSSASSYNFANAVTPIIRINGGSSGGLDLTGQTGAILIDFSHTCTSGVSIPGFGAPTVTNVGYGAKTFNPYTGNGWMLTWNGTAAQWRSITLVS